MGKYSVNQAAVDKARSLIDSHHYVLDSDWSEAQPSSEQENDQQERHGWKGLAEWYLAIDTEANEQTKDRYGFVYGDFNRLHRSGLIAAKQRAAQNDHDAIEKAADELLEALDGQSERS